MPLVFLLLLGLTAGTAAAGPEAEVERIAVGVAAVPSLPAGLRARIEASVARVAERLMLGQPVARVEEARAEYEGIIAEVFGRILLGFHVEGVEIAVGPEARVAVRLSPEGLQVESVRFSARPTGLPEPARAFLEENLAVSYPSFAAIFKGLPVEAFSWAEPILAEELAAAFAERFPGFRLEARFTPAPLLGVELGIAPLPPVVEGVEIKITSSSLPRIAATGWAGEVRASCQALEGLPLAYIRRLQTVLEGRCEEFLGARDAARRLALVWRVRLDPGTTTRVLAQVEADRYALEIAGRFIVGEANAIGLRARAGVHPLSRWEFAGELGLDSGGQGVNFSLSLVYALSPDLGLGFTHFLDAGGGRLLWLRYPLGTRDFFALKEDLATRTVSAAMALTLEDDLAVEFEVDSAKAYRLTFEVYL